VRAITTVSIQIQRAERGDAVIARARTPVARLIADETGQTKRGFDSMWAKVATERAATAGGRAAP
jgi:antitoxin (DNA-binding transcriptional repressor) of toxin-antitoxin stability system